VVRVSSDETKNERDGDRGTRVTSDDDERRKAKRWCEHHVLKPSRADENTYL